MSDSSQPGTVLVTGAAGFIGASVCKQLLAAGRIVVGLDNFDNYYDTGLKRHRIRDLESNSKFHMFEASIESRSDLESIFESHPFDSIINLAAQVGVRNSLENPARYYATNVNGCLNLLELCRANQIQKLVLASTSSLYAGQQTPFHEELSVNKPISPYAASKKAAEVLAYSYHHQFNLDVTVVRYFTVYGPAGRPDMSPFRFIKWIDSETPITLYGDGSQSRDFTYVDDIARGTVAALKHVGYEIVNLGGGNQPYSINELIARIENLLGKKAIINQRPFHQADMQTTWADISKAKKLLDWQPTVGLDDGLKRTVNWYTENLPWTRTIKT